MTDPSGAQVSRLDPSAIAEELAVRLDRSRGLREQMWSLQGSATSEDGAVTLSVDAAGRLTDVALDPSAMTLSPAELAALILATAREAIHDVERQSAGVVGDPPQGEIPLNSAQAMLTELGSEFRAQAGHDTTDFDQLHRRLSEGR